MRITPLDIRKQEFRKTMRGLDGDEVYAFLTTVAEEYEAVLSDNKKLRERIVEIEERLKEYKTIETNLRNTLLTAERVTNEAKENARKEANLIVREAEVDAEKAADAIKAHTQQLRREVLELKRQKDNYLTRFKTLLESHHRVLEGFQEDFANIDKEIEEIGQKVENDIKKGVQTPRMSREKITEQFAHGPKDKVTWDDEQRREDAPRPSVPPLGPSTASKPDENPFPPEEEAQGPPPFSDAQTSLLPDDEQYDTKHFEVDPIGAADESADDSPAPDWSSDEVRRNISKSIEDKLYPGAAPYGISGGGPGFAPEKGSEADAMHFGAPEQPQTAVRDQRPSPAPAPDEWKQYDVRSQKQDWKEYEIPAAAKTGKPAHPVVKDSEVEEALSGLKEFTDKGSGPVSGHDSEQDIVTLREEVPEASVKGKPAPQQKGAKPEASQKQAGGPPKKNETEWSMDDLRKNLSNLTNDD
jgi:cell division initiation protein